MRDNFWLLLEARSKRVDEFYEWKQIKFRRSYIKLWQWLRIFPFTLISIQQREPHRNSKWQENFYDIETPEIISMKTWIKIKISSIIKLNDSHRKSSLWNMRENCFIDEQHRSMNSKRSQWAGRSRRRVEIRVCWYAQPKIDECGLIKFTANPFAHKACVSALIIHRSM